MLYLFMVLIVLSILGIVCGIGSIIASITYVADYGPRPALVTWVIGSFMFVLFVLPLIFLAASTVGSVVNPV